MIEFDINQLHLYKNRNAIIFADQGVLTDVVSGSPLLPFSQINWNLIIQTAFYCEPHVIIKFQTSLSEDDLRKINCKIEPIRSALMNADSALQYDILKAYHWLNWDEGSRFCGRCGTVLNINLLKPEKNCQKCNKTFFPRFSPAVMVLVQRGNELLLARAPHFKPGVYSAFAGFLDIGETAEIAAHREVKEEAGIMISHLTYFATQTWPFPDSFMIAYKALYAGGEIIVDKNELEDAKWFNLNALPVLPAMPSIARKLIDSVIK